MFYTLNVFFLAYLLSLGGIEINIANLVSKNYVSFLLPRGPNLKGLLMGLQPDGSLAV